MELREPKRKRVGPHIKPQQPFPIIIESENGIPAKKEYWPVYTGNFTGDAVIVSNPEEMISVYTMGFFGKGSFSRGYPNFGQPKHGLPPIIKERQWQRRKSWMETMRNTIAETQQEGSEKTQPKDSKSLITNVQREQDVTNMEIDDSLNPIDGTNGSDKPADAMQTNNASSSLLVSDKEIKTVNSVNKVLVLADSDDEDVEKVIRDPQPHLEDESIKTAVETLVLTLEEAFFLAYGLGCLNVIDITGQPLRLKQLWQTFCEAKSDFVESYVAYHYFRAKGWVVKSGYKFGGDFLLYKQGPAFYHASYVVLVEKVNYKLERLKESFSWIKLDGINRIAEAKDIIICQVVFPDNLTAEDLKTPKSLKRFQVNETLLRRWVPLRDRDDKTDILE